MNTLCCGRQQMPQSCKCSQHVFGCSVVCILHKPVQCWWLWNVNNVCHDVAMCFLELDYCQYRYLIIRHHKASIFVAKHLYCSDFVCLDLLYTEGAQNFLSLVEKCESILPFINQCICHYTHWLAKRHSMSATIQYDSTRTGIYASLLFTCVLNSYSHQIRHRVKSWQGCLVGVSHR